MTETKTNSAIVMDSMARARMTGAFDHWDAERILSDLNQAGRLKVSKLDEKAVENRIFNLILGKDAVKASRDVVRYISHLGF